MTRLYVCALGVEGTHGPVTHVHITFKRPWDPLMDAVFTEPNLEAFGMMANGIPDVYRNILREIAYYRDKVTHDYPYTFTFDDDNMSAERIHIWLNSHPPDELRSILHKAGRSDLLHFIRANPHWSR